MRNSLLALGLTVSLVGCMDSLDKQVQKQDSPVLGKKTQDVGQFDPNAKNVVSDSKVVVTDPILGGAQAYGPIMEQIAKLGIDSALGTFYALEGRYPKDHEEFMTQIIKANNLQLPVLPGGKKYQYDVENHKLVVVEAPVEGATPGQ